MATLPRSVICKLSVRRRRTQATLQPMLSKLQAQDAVLSIKLSFTTSMDGWYRAPLPLELLTTTADLRTSMASIAQKASTRLECPVARMVCRLLSINVAWTFQRDL